MGAVSFWGHLLVGLGPLAAAFMAVVARKSFLVLLALARCGVIRRPGSLCAAPGASAAA